MKSVFDKAVAGPNGCVVYVGHRNQDGYGRVNTGNGLEMAHRLSYRESVAPIPPGMQVLHRCDNPPCVNPNHLFLGTHLDNMADRAAKGRYNCRGSSNARARLAEADIQSVLDRVASGETTARIGSDYGLTGCAIHDVVHARSWAHVRADRAPALAALRARIGKYSRAKLGLTRRAQ